jgi:uncharacterized membrane protein
VAWLDKGGRYLASFWWLIISAIAVFVAGFWVKPWTQSVIKAVIAALVVLGLLYPLGATIGRISRTSGFKNPSLDGLAFMAQRQVRSADASNLDYDLNDKVFIDWLNTNADKTETVLEAPGTEMYKGLTRISIYTGLPTLLGWEYQIGQQLGGRAGQQLRQRRLDADQIYMSLDPEHKKNLLKKYSVRWIVVGSIEQKRYPSAALELFNTMAEPVAESNGRILYRYDY